MANNKLIKLSSEKEHWNAIWVYTVFATKSHGAKKLIDHAENKRNGCKYTVWTINKTDYSEKSPEQEKKTHHCSGWWKERIEKEKVAP